MKEPSWLVICDHLGACLDAAGFTGWPADSLKVPQSTGAAWQAGCTAGFIGLVAAGIH